MRLRKAHGKVIEIEGSLELIIIILEIERRTFEKSDKQKK